MLSFLKLEWHDKGKIEILTSLITLKRYRYSSLSNEVINEIKVDNKMTQERIKEETSARNPKTSGDQSSPAPEEYQTAPSTVTEYFTVSSSNLNINDDPVKDAKLPTKVFISHFFILRPQKYRTGVTQSQHYIYSQF